MTTTHETALLLVAHGTPASLDDIPAFLNNIRRGRPTPQAIVDAVRLRYEAIGGRSPQLDVTREQARKLSTRLDIPCFVAMRMWSPTFDEVLREIAEHTTLRELFVVVMAPHSAHVYEQALRAEAARLVEQGVNIPALRVAPCWGDEPRLLDAWAASTLAFLDTLDPRKRARAVLVPSAHSLPLRVVQDGDPYPQLVTATADGVIARLGHDALPPLLAFQSQGMTSDPWLGPDLPTVFARAAHSGAQGVIVIPLGFLTDHVETLYDLDIEAKLIAKEHGLWLERAPCLNASDALIDAVVDVVERLRGT